MKHPRRTKVRRFDYTVNSKPIAAEEGMALVLGASLRLAERSAATRMARRNFRIDTLPRERRSVERAMLAVEERLVKALWVIERSERADRPKGYEGRNGVDYSHDRLDTHARFTDAPGGKYDSAPPKASPPESREITEARQTQKWIGLLLDPQERRVLTVAAMSKRGDAGRRVNWHRVKERLPELDDYSTRGLQGIYARALRSIVAELTAKRLGA